jgi:uncharacterized repeat protein (TIGR03843 family)
MMQPISSTQQRQEDLEHTLELLSKGKMEKSHGLMPWSSNYTFLVTVRDAGVKTLAIYKPRRGERPLWDFPDGSLALREVAAFHVSRALGWDFVPPTVLREGFLGLGAVQLFIEADPEEHYFTLRDEHVPVFQRVALFDYIVNNADRKAGHCLRDRDGHIWTIDHGLTFNVEYKVRTVIWDFAGQPIPDDILADLCRLQQALNQPSSPIMSELAPLITEREIVMFRKRLDRIINAEAFPLPGAGRNVPYPPI